MQMLTVKQISEEMQVHIETVRRWIKKGKLKAFNNGKAYRVKRSDLNEFIDENSNK